MRVDIISLIAGLLTASALGEGDLHLFSTTTTNSEMGTLSVEDVYTRGGVTNLIRSQQSGLRVAPRWHDLYGNGRRLATLSESEGWFRVFTEGNSGFDLAFTFDPDQTLKEVRVTTTNGIIVDHFMVTNMVLTPVSGAELQSMKVNQLLVSCLSHRKFLEFDLHLEFAGAGGKEKAQPPYEPNVPGYEMFAKYAGQKPRGGYNCNHGAPGSLIGGWQAVNLSPEHWRAVHRLWSARGYSGLPFFWCGKPNPGQTRVFTTLWLDDEGVWFLDHHVLEEAELRERIGWLNECLGELGLPPVAMDVPDEIKWDSFDTGAQQ